MTADAVAAPEQQLDRACQPCRQVPPPAIPPDQHRALAARRPAEQQLDRSVRAVARRDGTWGITSGPVAARAAKQPRARARPLQSSTSTRKPTDAQRPLAGPP